MHNSKENLGLVTFKCGNCGKEVDSSSLTGSRQRNHCPFCLSSKHVDETIPGDRQAKCHGIMMPVALTFKEEGFDKYGKKRQGELMLVHKCEKCGKISINRIAADDDPKEILAVFKKSLNLKKADFTFQILGKADETEVNKQLFGKI